MDKTDKIKQEEYPLPRYVQEVLSKHNISLRVCQNTNIISIILQFETI